MKRTRTRKCLWCGDLFEPDPRNAPLLGHKTGMDNANTQPWLRKILVRTSPRPAHVAPLAGTFGCPRYGFRDRQMLRLCGEMQHGCTRAVISSDGPRSGRTAP